MGFVKVIVDTKQRLSQIFSADLALRTKRAESRSVRLALSGGSAAERLLPDLVDAAIDMNRLEIFFCDERAVPLTDDQSNFRLAQQCWFRRCATQPLAVHPLAGADLDQVSKQYANLLSQRSTPLLDVTLLGMGPDGHTASLFPGHATLQSDRLVEVIVDSPKPPPVRMTLTLAALAQVECHFLAVFGESKAEALVNALSGDLDLPIARVFDRAPRTVVLCDAAAASRLPADWTDGRERAFTPQPQQSQ